MLQIVNGPGPISGTPTNMDDIYTPAYDYLVSKLDITQLIQYDTLHLDAVVNWTKVNTPGRYLESRPDACEFLRLPYRAFCCIVLMYG